MRYRLLACQSNTHRLRHLPRTVLTGIIRGVTQVDNPMAKWKVNTQKGLIIGIAVLVLIIAVDVVLIWLATQRPVSIGTFLIGTAVLISVGFLGLMGYWLYGLVNTGYSLDRNALVIHWGTTEQTIPLHEVKRVFTGDELEENVRFTGGVWPGHFVGYGEVPETGTALFYATVPPREQVFVVTPGLTYGISPADQGAFLESLAQRMQMGPTQIVEQTSKRPGFLSWQIWHDKPGLILLGANCAVLLALVGLLCYRLPALPNMIPMHFSPAGEPDRMGARVNIFVLPVISILVLLLNAAVGFVLLHRERIASYLLWGGALLVQLLAWAAAVGILTQV